MVPPMPDQESQPYPELASFGEELRREREIRGISLKEIADATKISKRFLEAIERNDHRTLPAPVFTRGFVREYARYLGLSAEDVVNRYNFAAAGDDRIEKSPHLDRLVQPVIHEPVREPAPKKGIPPAYARIDRNVFITIFIVAALIGVSYWAVTRKRALADQARNDAPAAAPARMKSTPPMATTSPAAPIAPADEMLHMTVEVIGNSWIALEADGKTVFSDEMKKGQSYTFAAKNQFKFRRIGNAAGVVVTVNETHFPPLGGDGEVVRNRIIDREALVTATQNTNGSRRD